LPTGAIRLKAKTYLHLRKWRNLMAENEVYDLGIRMDHDGYVETDEKCETNLPGIFVIGDLRRKYAKQIVLAAADGCTAALAAAHMVEMKKAGQSCKVE
jgi:thioredoxin reductase (NADPH)